MDLSQASAKLPSRQPFDPNLLREVFVDESSQTKHKYLCLGGLMVHGPHVQAFEDRIRQARSPELPHGELAWTKVSMAKLPAYERIVDTAFSAMTEIPFNQFHMLVVDTHKIKDSVYNKGNRDTGFNKEIYQLCQKFGRINRTALFHVYLDQRSTKSSTNELRNILNLGIRRKQPGRDWPFRRVHFRDSAECLSIQVVDLFLGAVAFRLNGHRDAPGASAAKCSLSDRVLSLANVANPFRDTAINGRFTIWHRLLK